ncbi:Hypothetical predicted protein [Paramuricea clavata]|uniref:Uncharacterized protein n=1 Tax=Paramuricea clavata TaxID=317549 RepID=A0A7D9E1I0_PARCT|nr:Hypothetical predicted protein [Paramuricea clavata]
MWMDSYLCPSAHEDLYVNTDFRVDISHPTSRFNWNNFLDTALPVFNVNFYQSVMMIAGAIACFHYPYAIAIADACPAPMAIGAPSSGKSTTIDVIATMLGCNVESQATCEVIQSLLNKTTVPLCWDHPTYPSSVKKLLTGTFDSKGKRTKGRGKEIPSTNVVLAVNFELHDDVRSFERIVPIVYNAPPAPKDPADYRKATDRLEEEANTGCIPWIIKLGEKLANNNNLIIDDYNIGDLGTAAPSISLKCFEEYIEQTFLLYVRKVIPPSSAVNTQEKLHEVTEFFECLQEILQNTTGPDEVDLQKCIRPCVQTATKEDEYALHLILPEVLEIIKKRTDKHTSFNLTKLRRSISGYSDGTSVDHSGVFGGAQRRCIKIPRSIVDKDLLDLIDKACGRDDDGNTQNDIEHGNEGDNGKNINENYNQQINDMKKTLDASEEHNVSLISDKKKLERDLSREKIKFTQAEEKIGNLERELAEKKRRWEAEEKELYETITKLRAAIKQKPDTSCQSIAATSFANVVSSEDTHQLVSFMDEKRSLDDSGISLEANEEVATTPAISFAAQRKKRRLNELQKLKDGLNKDLMAVEGKSI